MKKKIIIITSILAFLLALLYFNRGYLRDYWEARTKEPIPEAISFDSINTNGNTNQTVEFTNSQPANSQPATLNANTISNQNTNSSDTLKNTNTSIPAEINLKVPFTSQAPNADWSDPFEEACEEASSIMVNAFYKNISLTKDKVTKKILDMVEWEKKFFGSHKDLTAKETATMIQKYFGYEKVEVKYDISIDDVKAEVAKGRPVILPCAGRELKNPNFKQPGPIYHMLVVKGYTKTKIITNDPGTRKGADYTYDPKVLYNAIHDWNNGDVPKGKKAMIVVYP